ncbi:MAG TPA: ABC transporter ATP-binding protein [Leptolyngbyaceae cyanobacterium M33_DOE_097]|uniref:ABC transporter ATP-binding protein n=1 Tax=Oscillatoriales cyanobacterium SpSt-418 TaxID=2282169 RepID=A0A7C3PE16_9CYAN|nr:ABC transporter ATP-binding protein [Leptolyngbyaceae cyanobacterium M33_DOE_097]
MAQVVLENVYKSFASRREAVSETGGSDSEKHKISASSINVLRNISLSVNDGEFMVLVGPSGCGKSTLLRLIAGLEDATGGNIWVGDRRVNHLPPKERDIAMVFQNYALYPHLTVYDNLAFGLRRTNNPVSAKSQDEGDSQKALPTWAETFLVESSRNLPRGLRYRSQRERAIAQQVQVVAQQLQIEPLLNRLPKQLSGGQKQRVALGRAMARNPQVFLMDEPLSNLDAKLRAETRSQIVKLQRQLGITTIYVTHDQTEAMTMGDRITVLSGGQIQQIGSPLELYHRPTNRFVAEFIGSPPMNFLPVTFKAPLLLTRGEFRLTLPEAWETVLKSYDGQSLVLGIRPEHFTIAPAAPKNLPVQVELVEALGSETYLMVRLLEAREEPIVLQVRVEPDRPIKVGEQLWLAIAIDKLHLFDPNTEQALYPASL